MMEEEEDLGRAEEGKRREVRLRGDHAVESEGELRAEMALKPIKQEPEEEERQQRWEAQWQEFLKSLQAPYLGRKYPQLPPSRLGEGPTTFQSSFQRTAQAAPWPGGECGIQNLPSRTKEAHKVWGVSPDSSAAVKEELDEDDSIVSEVHRRRFRRFCYWEAEGPREVCWQLQELCRQWLKPETSSKEQIVELITLEQFLRVLPAEVQSRVRQGGPETCAQAVVLAEDFIQEWERKEGQYLEPFEEVIIHSPKTEQDPSDAEEMQLTTEAELESDGDTNMFSNVAVNENQPERHEYVATTRMTLGEQNFHSKRPQNVKEREKSLEKATRTLCQVPIVDENPLSRQRLEQPQENLPGKEPVQTTDGKDENDRSINQSQERISECIPGKIISEWEENFGPTLAGPAKTPSYECSYCGKRWPCPSQLRRHVTVHTGERPHKCMDCGKSFSTSSNLGQHKRMHTGERPYNCKDCGKSYRRRASLVQHEREACQKGSRISAPAVGYVVLGNCTLLCMKKSTQGGRNRVIAPKGGEAPLAAQPLSILTGYPQERSPSGD
uniref:Uncharacterized protein n=1 Tax=Pogona vitticeps TaxID=103695 RepID=A0ABM5FGV9_9SAUR